MEHLKTTVEQLFAFDRQLMGPGYDAALEYLNMLIPLNILEFKTGKQYGTWTVPEEWVVREAWVKYKGKKILDYTKNPLSLVVYSLPFKGKVSKEELLKHLHFSEELPDATPYIFKFYDRDWGFSIPKIKLDKLKDGDYEVFIDTEFKPGRMKVGIYTIKGKSDREILLFAHLDHPYQANDNLSGVACLLDLAHKLKAKHTIKLIFCPETIGSQAYAYTQNLSKVDFVIAVDICGNDNNILVQKAWDNENRLNRVAHCALQLAGQPYRKGKFRTMIGSDETVFNDPLIGIPGLLISRWPYKEYHTDADTPDKLDYEKIIETSDFIRKIIEIYEKDYIPKRLWKGPLMRSRYGIQSPLKIVNLNWDYLFYGVGDGRSVAELCSDFEISFDEVYELLEKIIQDGKLTRISFDFGQRRKQKTQK